MQYQLPPGLLASLCYVESNHDVRKIHYNDGESHSYGICQIKLSTARGLGFRGTAMELMRPERNIHYAAVYLQHQLVRYHGDIARGVVAYNRGNARHLTTSSYQRKVYKVWLTSGHYYSQFLSASQLARKISMRSQARE